MSPRRGRCSTSSAPGWATTPPPAASCEGTGLWCIPCILYMPCGAKPRLRGLCALQPCARSRVGGLWTNQVTRAGQHLAEHSPGVPPRPTAQGCSAPHRRTRSTTVGAVSLVSGKLAVCAPPTSAAATLAEAASCLVGYGAGGKPRPGKDHLPAVPLPGQCTGGRALAGRGRGDQV